MADKQTDKKYWFRPKRYGWGWGMPATFQGWIAFGIFVAIWLLALNWLLMPYPENDIPTSNIVWFLVILFADILALGYVSFKYGEPPKWNWGKRHDKPAKSAKPKSD